MFFETDRIAIRANTAMRVTALITTTTPMIPGFELIGCNEAVLFVIVSTSLKQTEVRIAESVTFFVGVRGLARMGAGSLPDQHHYVQKSPWYALEVEL